MRTLAKVFEGLQDFVVVYVDDVLIHSKEEDFNIHLEHLEQVFERLKEFNMKLAPKKSLLGRRSVSFLGHTITPEGYSPDNLNLEPIRTYPTPADKEELRRFLGMCGYFRKFINSYSGLTEPLWSLLRKDAEFLWDKQKDEAFMSLRQMLMEKPLLAFPD